MSSQYYPLPYVTDTSGYFACIQAAPGAIWLDSGRPHCTSGRYDICSAWPSRQLQLQPNESTGEFLIRTRAMLHTLPAEACPVADLPFTGGLLGYLAYSAGVPKSRHASQLVPASIGLYPWALINDHQSQRTGLICHSSVPAARQQQLVALFNPSAPKTTETFALSQPFQAQIQPDEYQAAIARIQSLIEQGECEQVNFAQSFSSYYQGDPWQAYLSLRAACPTPYASFIRLGAQDAVLSASPECFLQAQQQQVRTYPIKGTRPRGATALLDKQLAEELRNSDKDQRENLMIVELMLQELVQCCHPDTLHTPQLCQLESFANVHHLVSCITGQLSQGKDALDLLQHCFPAGSISGTPKNNVIEMIDTLEAGSREVYCGSVFYLSNHGHFDSSVTIRTLLAQDGLLRCWGGGGITQGSDWQAEYQESIDKVSVLMRCLEEAHLVR